MIGERNLRRGLHGAIVLCALGVIAAVIAALAPVDVSLPDVPNDRTATAPAADEDGEGRPLDAYAVVWRHPLRPPLYDPPPEPPAPEPEPKLTVRLTATIVEPGAAFAVFATPAGREQLVAVGDEVEGVRVASVRPGEATVEFAGKEITLHVPDREDSP